MCRGIEEHEVKTISNAIKTENGMFYLSRIYVPLGLFSLYRKGVFAESFTFMEFKYVLRIAIVMYLIELSGFYLFRRMTLPIVDKYVGDNESEYENKKKVMSDYLIQRDYFKNKKANK